MKNSNVLILLLSAIAVILVLNYFSPPNDAFAKPNLPEAPIAEQNSDVIVGSPAQGANGQNIFWVVYKRPKNERDAWLGKPFEAEKERVSMCVYRIEPSGNTCAVKLLGARDLTFDLKMKHYDDATKAEVENIIEKFIKANPK